jgi:preprotein translocase subunit YajC
MNAISIAQAQAPAAGAPPISNFILIFLIFGVMMFFMFRSQKRQAKEREAMLNSIKAGDEIITNGGIKGKVTKVTDKSFFVRVADKVDLEVVRNGVATVVKPEKENAEGGVEEKK